MISQQEANKLQQQTTSEEEILPEHYEEEVENQTSRDIEPPSSSTQKKKRNVRFKVADKNNGKEKPSVANQKAVMIYHQLIDEAIKKIIFSLIDQESVSELYLDFVSKLLQPMHFEEVLEERNSSGWCGNPLCSNEIDQDSLGRAPKYYIDFARKELVDVSNFTPRLFCCDACKKVAFNKMNACPSTVPYTRSCTKLLSMLFPEMGEQKLTKILRQVTEVTLGDKQATISIKVKENLTPKKPVIGANDPMVNCNTDAIEGFVPAGGKREERTEVKKFGFFFEQGSDDEEEEEIEDVPFDMFQELWTLFSRLVTRSTIRLCQEFDIGTSHKPTIEVKNVEGEEKSKKSNGVSYEDMKIYQEMYKEMGIDISEDVNELKPTASYEFYSEDGGKMDDQVHLERMQFFKESLTGLVPTICNSLGHTNFSKIRTQMTDIISTFSYTFALPSLDTKRLRVICLIMMKIFASKDTEFMMDLIDIQNQVAPEMITVGQKQLEKKKVVIKKQKKTLQEQQILLEKCLESIKAGLLKEGLNESQITLLTDVILFGVY